MTFNKYNDYKEHFKDPILRNSKLCSYETDYIGNRLLLTSILLANKWVYKRSVFSIIIHLKWTS